MSTRHATAAQTAATPAPRPRRNLLVVGASGLLLFLSLWLDGPEELPHDATADQVRRHIVGNLDAIGLQVFGGTLGLTALLVMVVSLRAAMRAALLETDDEQRTWMDLVTIGGVLTALWFWVTAAVEMIPLVAVDDAGKLSEYDGSTLLGLDLFGRLGETFGDISTVPRGLFVLGVSVLVIRTRLVPRWVGHLGLIVAAASLGSIIGTGWDVAVFSIAWFVGLFGFVLWVLCLSVSALVRGLRHDRTPATPG